MGGFGRISLQKLLELPTRATRKSWPGLCKFMLHLLPFRTYLWLDEKGKKNKLSAPQYVDYVMTYVQKVVNDESTFPTKHGNEFPANFDQVLRKIQKLLFHVVAHIYHSHFKEVTLQR